MPPTIMSYKDLRALGLDRAIAAAYADATAARTLLIRIDFPPSAIPRFDDASTFWTETFGKIEHGILEGPTPATGFETLLRQSARDRPGNPMFHAWRSAVESSTLPGNESAPDALTARPPLGAQQWTRFDVFLSYNTRDVGAVENIAQRLVQRHVFPWLDRWHLAAGMIIDEVLRDVLRNTPALVVFVGPEGLGPWQAREVRHAVSTLAQEERTTPQIPVLLPGARKHVPELPLGIGERSWVEFRDLDDVEALDQLIRGIGKRAPPNSVSRT